MRLLPKLLLGILGASAVPIAVSGVVSTTLAERALRARVEQDFVTLAAGTADDVRRTMADLGRALAVYPQLADLDHAPAEVGAGVLRVAYRAHEDLVDVAFLDEAGVERLPAARLADPAAAQALGRAPVDDAAHAAFLGRVPRAAAVERGFAVGPPDVAAGRIAVAVAVAGAPRKLLAADVAVDRLARRLAALSVGGIEVVLVDGARRVVAGGAGRAVGSTVALARDERPDGPLPRVVAVSSVDDRGHVALSAYAPVADLGLGVAVLQPEAMAFAAVDDLRARLYFWLGVAALAAAVVGVGLSRDLLGRVRALASGTRALAGGRFVRVDLEGSDELAELAGAFNHMSEDLGRAQGELLAWSRELERRVEEKTAELRAAEELLLRARSLAAVGTLGAGVAHEINNPLTGLLGSAQLLLMDTPEDDRATPLLRDIEAQAQRIRAIVGNLLRVVRADRGEAVVPVDLVAVVESALERSAGDLEADKIRVERSLGKVPPLRGNPELLEEAVRELITNARRAMPAGGTLSISTSSPDPRLVVLRVADTGSGIAPDIMGRIFDPFFTTKASWRATGFGLTLVHKIISDHGGRIDVESQVGQGATFTLTFPAPAPAHLA